MSEQAYTLRWCAGEGQDVHVRTYADEAKALAAYVNVVRVLPRVAGAWAQRTAGGVVVAAASGGPSTIPGFRRQPGKEARR